jgi:Mg2+ and Co2+ transporter CorA
MLPIIIVPLVVALSSEILDFLDICDWLIIGIFIVEYGSKLYLSKNRWAHFKSSWHLLDLFIIIVPFAQYAPLLGLKVTGSPSLLLRLLRLPRALALGTRALAQRMKEEEPAAIVQPEEVQTVIRSVDRDFKTVHENLTWDRLRGHLSSEEQEWIDLYNVNDESFNILSEILSIPEPHFKSNLFDEIYPHVDHLDQASMVFLQSGKIKRPEYGNSNLEVSRSGVLIICNGPKIITISRQSTSLFENVLLTCRRVAVNGSFVVSILYGIFEHILREHRSILSEIEVDLSRASSIPRSKLPKDFLEKIYKVAKEVSKLSGNLVHLEETLGSIIARRVLLDGFDESSEEIFDVLRDEASHINDVVDNLKDTIRSSIDLYINRTSFETNRILKILAVITSIALIPATISGLLGENVLNQPFGVYLWQIVLLTSIVVSLVVYMFVKLGWLKT